MGNSTPQRRTIHKPRIFTHVCRYCGISCLKQDMKKVTEKPKNLSEWIRILGPKFACNIRMFTCNYICQSHFVDNYSRYHKLPIKMENEPEFGIRRIKKEVEKYPTHVKEEKMSYDDPAEESAHSLSDMMGIEADCNSQSLENGDENNEIQDVFDWDEIRAPDIEQKCQVNVNERSTTGKMVESPSNYSQCRVCEIYRSTSGMIESPETPKVLFKWMNDLGPDYVKNIAKNPPPHFVCHTHLDTVPSKKGHLKKPIEQFECRVCNIYRDKNRMTESPEDPDILFEWLKVLGPDYVDNIAKNSPRHFVCNRHLGTALSKMGITEKPQSLSETKDSGRDQEPYTITVYPFKQTIPKLSKTEDSGVNQVVYTIEDSSSESEQEEDDENLTVLYLPSSPDSKNGSKL